MANLYAGETILIEATIKKAVPFGTAAVYDPVNGAKVSIYLNDTALISSQAMTKSNTGLYYYYYQSVIGKSGRYRYEITADDTTYDGYIEGEFKLL